MWPGLHRSLSDSWSIGWAESPIGELEGNLRLPEGIWRFSQKYWYQYIWRLAHERTSRIRITLTRCSSSMLRLSIIQRFHAIVCACDWQIYSTCRSIYIPSWSVVKLWRSQKNTIWYWKCVHIPELVYQFDNWPTHYLFEGLGTAGTGVSDEQSSARHSQP